VLPQTNYHQDNSNPVVQHFWGLVPVSNAVAYYHFVKGERVQHLLHALKYSNRPDVGIYVGECYGALLKDYEAFQTIDVIVPVPLHQDKLQWRGYNQSEAFAQGLATTMKIPVDAGLIIRNEATETQTRKHRFERYINVNQKFSILESADLKGKHILLVDDVITTGATLIACAEALVSKHATVSIAAIAAAGH
jgi:ComF family protein